MITITLTPLDLMILKIVGMCAITGVVLWILRILYHLYFGTK